ncbi:hypothetical protein Q8A67_005425 [Cirrhinus molitorella]|uniref:Uncharacterized protein n=1 Tax=Cirrhinus molitorella TaxID=172907 RepID=A0AA88TXE2_9TELE|nr:hypothetical protein Q8A67_005425 [Cirrhinus molitorella]
MTATTRKKLLSNKILIAFVLFCGHFTSVLHGQYVTNQFNAEIQQAESENRTVNVSMQTYNSVEVNYTTSVLSHIPESELNFSAKLDSQTNVSVAALFASLDDFTETTVRDLPFVENWLYWKFLPVLSYTNEEFAKRLSQMNFTCGAFHIIVEVLSREESMITDRQQQLIFTHLIYSYLSRTDTAGCHSNVTSDHEWLQRNFGIFSKYATLRQLQTLSSHFTEFDLLELLSPSQLAELTVTSGALNSMNIINIIFDHLEEGDALQNTEEFFSTLIQSEDMDINPVVRDIMMNRTFTIISLHFADFLSHDWVSWFTVKLVPLLPSLTAEMLQTVTANTDCNAYHVIVGALSSVFDQMTSLRQQELTPVMVFYLKQHRPWSSSCGSSTSSLSAWLEQSFGKFSIYVDYKDLRDLHTGFDGFESLDLLSASQVAQLTLQSGALNNVHLMEMVFDRLEDGNAFHDIEEFLEALTRSSQDLDINPVVRDIMMNRTFTIISLHFADFLSHDWVSWFTVKLVPLLPSLTAEMLQTVTANTDCNAYHVIVGALSSVFDQMTSLRQQELTPVMVFYLKQHRPWSSSCGSSTSSLSAWLEESFGKFSIYVDYKDLRDLHTGFDGFESLDLLSASQVAQLTLQSGALNNVHLMEMVFDRLEDGNAFHDIEEFLEALTRSSQDLDINPVVRDIMMNRTFTIISLHFADFLSHDWVSWFTVKLVPLLPSLTAEMLQTVTANTDCNAYHVIVGALSSVFDQMTSLRQQELTPVMVFYLKQHRPWSSSCGSSTSSLSAWLEESFGKFSIYVDYKDLRDLHTGFDGFESLDLLSASQVAQLTLQSGALNNVHLMEMVFDRLEDGNAFHDIEEFLEALTRSSQDLDINPVVRDIMMNRTFTIISLHFADFLSHDWVSWFTVKLVPLLPSLTAEMLQTVTANTDCNAYHVIVGALSSVFDQMTSLRQQELTPVMVFYLKQHRPWSSSCGSSTSSLSAWLEESFGKFSIYVDYKDLRDLHTGFDGFESLDLLSASQVAQLTLQSGALNNVHLMEMVFDRLEDGNAFHDIEEFLEALTRSSQDLDINPVVRDIMMNRTFTIISLHFADFLSHDWVSWFTVKLVPLLPSLTAEMLQTVTANTDCNAYHVIVGALSSVFDQMTSLRQQELTPVMVFYLKQHRPWSSSCGSSTSSLSAWLEESFGKFSIYVDYKDLRDLHTGFDGFESLDLLSASQVAQLTLQSGALNNVHLMEMVYDRLEDGNAFHDIEEFLEALTRSSQDLDINPVVRDIMMNRTFTIISLHFADFLSHDWVSWFTVKLVPLLPSLTAEMLQTVTANTDCNAYHVIVGALSSVFDQMTSLRQQELTPVMVFYLKQHRPWSSSCGSSTSSLSAWLEESFGKFSIYVDYKDLRDLHTGFDGFESLDLLSASQVAQLTLQSGALNNVHLMEMVFDRLEDGNAFHDIEEFLEALTRSSQDLDINPVVRDIMMNRTFTIISLHFADFLSHDWVSWFTVKLVPLLPSLTAEMLQTVTANTDCNAYHVIVGALSSVFDQMTSLRQQELTPVMVFYLKQHRPWSSSCGSSTSSLSAWLEESFGKFSIYVDYKDLRDLHTGFDGFESLDLLSASQVAQLTLQSGALNNVHLMEMVFDRLEDGNAFHDIEEFLEALTRSSQDLDINPVVRDIMMNRTFTIISLHFADFLSHDWVSWFTVKLVPLLPSLTAEMLQTVTANTDCNAYHVIVGALSSVFDQMTSLRQQELTPVMVFYLKQHRPWSSSCGSSTSSLSAWLEESFGKFSIYVDYKDLRDLHTGFDGFESLDLLSASQVAQLTLQSGALNNVHLMEMVFDRLEDGNAFHDIEEFLEALTRSSQDLDINPVVRDIMMNRTFTIISLHFANFLSHDWVSWFTVKLVPLLPSLTGEMLQTVTANTDCNAYHVIVGALSSVFDQMTSLRQQELTPVMVFYLKQHRPWSSSCGSSTSSLSAWLEESFGKFSIYVDYKDLRDLHTGFDGFESLDLLSASQVAQLTLQSGALNNVHLMEMVFDRLEDGNAFHDIEEFLEALTRSSQDLDINPVVRDIMMNRTFTIISLHFADFLSHDWVSWFTVKLVPLLPSLTAEMLQTVTANTDCNAYHVIVGALSSVFDQMTSLRQQELTPVMVFYLKQHRPWSSSCGSSTSSLSAWLEESFGKFSIYVDYKDLRDLHTGFDGFESLDLLSASQVAQLTLQSGALNNVHLMEMVFDRLEDGNAFHDIEEFLEALTRSSQDLDINPVVRDIMMNRTFTIISLHFADFLSHDWVSWFTVKLVPLLPSLTAEMLQTVTANTDCNAYHVIVGALSSVFDQMTSLRQQELTPVMVFYLKQHRPWSSSCGSSTSSLSAWLEESFGKFSIYVDYKDLRDLHTGFDGFESLDLLSASQVAQLTLQSGALNNVHLMEMVFDRLEDGNAFHDIEEFLEALTRSSQDLDINPVVRDIMMNRTFTIISLHFADFLSHDWVSWFTVKLVPLLPSLTGEMLQTVTANTDCNAYHVIVGALSSVFDQMTSLRQQELTPVMVFYLKQHRPWSSSCGSSTSSLSAWLEESFGKFSIYVDYKDLRDLHTGFDGFESLDLLSASQVAQLTLQSGALNNVHLMEMVFDRLEDGNAFHDIEEFLEALTRSSQDLDINPVVRDIMMNRTFTIISLHFADFLSHDWVSWFTVKLVPLLPSLTAEMLQTVTANTDCNAYHVIVGALSSVFDQMTSLRQQELTPVMVFYLKQHRPWSSSCGSSTSSLSAWLEESFGKFSIYVDYKDLRDLHTGFDGFESLDLLSASQVAQLTLQSGALNNVHLMEMVFDRLEDGNAFHDIEEFLEALTRSSQDLDINPVVRDIMMNRTFTIISLHFADFLSHDWVSWFTVKLVPLLPSLTAEMLQTVTANTDCNAYHVIVGALSSVFDQMTSLRQQELTPVMVFYLKQHRPWSSSCGSSTSSLSAWLEESFGKFSIYVDYKDLRDLHTGFDGFESLDLLSASQVAQLTLQSGALNNVHLMEMVFDRLEDGNAFHDIEEFLEALTRSSQDLDINPVVRDIMMNRTFTIISLHFADFLSHDWVSWFTVKLVPLLPSLTAEMLQTVTANTDCNAYHVIVGALSSVFDQMTSLRQQELTPVMVFYLKQHRPWSSSCGSSTSSLSAWLEESFGKFSIYVDYKDLRDLHTGFDGFESLDLLSASQVAQLTLQSGALNNVHLMEMVFDRLEDGNAFHDIEEFLEALTRSSQDLDINPVVRDIMMNRTFTIISLHFADFLSHDWVSWFTVKLVPLLPSLTAEMLQTVTANTDCNAYHVIVGALSSVFDQMTSLRQQELTPVMVFYLKQHRPWSSSCGSSTSSLSAWLEESFGKFSIYVDYKDLRDLHTGFDGFESLDLLSASQVAQLTLQSGALNNVHLMEMVFDRLEDGNAFHDIEEFLEALTRSSQDLDINPVVRDIMMNRTFTIISLHFADFLSHDCVSWFTVKLVPLLPSLTAEMLQTVTANTDCNAYHVIVGALSSVFDQMTSLRQQELTPVMVFYLKQHRPWSSSCGSSTSSLSAWLEESFGKFSIYVDYKDLRDLHTGFDGFESLDLLSASQVAQLTLQSGALNNVHLMEMVFDRLEDGNAFHDIEEFLEALTRSSQDLDINPVVRDIMMNRTFTIISLHFADFLSHDWVSWFTVKLVPLLPSLTAEMLQTVTANTDCNAYHVIVGALSSVFDQMTSLRQQELTPVMVFYLKQHRPWSSSCGSSTSSLSAWLEESFGKFSIYVDYKDLRDLHTGFDGFESLDLLSASQVAQLTLQSGALNNVHLMEMVFDRLEDGNAFHDIEEFLEALTRSSQDLDINPVVRDIMMNRTFTIISLHFADFLSHDWVSWFTVKLVPLLPSLTGEMLQTVTANTDCNAYHVIVGALSSVFDQMTSLRQQELTPIMVFYLKQHRPWSSSCGSSTSSLSAWLEESFGKFSIYVDYKDLRDLHTGFDGFESLDLLSASQVAQLTLQSGALNNVHLMEMVYDRLEDGNAFHDIEEFLEALTRSSQDLDINPVVRDIMMNRTFTIISLHFADFLSHDWVSWFTVKLVPLLPSLTAEMLQTVTANTDCNAYHVIVGALSSVFDQMTSLRQQELTPVMVFYLKQHRPWSSSCGSSTSSLSAWLEESFGKFSIYVDYKDLRDLHTGFDGFESLDLLSASQVAQLTLQSGALNNVHLMEMVFDRLEDGNAFHDIEEFLEALTRSSQDLDINPVVRDIMMNRTFTIISLHFADFLSHDWVSWFTVKLVPLLPSLTAEMLQTVTANTDCNAYHVIVGALSSVFDQMTSLRQQELTPVMVFYLKQHRPWSSSCGSSTSSLSAWLEESFGKFSIYVDYKDLRDLHTGFDGFESLDLLSASQVAQLTLQSGALNNVHLMEMVFDRLEDGNAFHDIEEFLEALTRSSQDLDINPVVRDIMMNRTFTIISLHFADFLSHDWVSWFTVKLVPLLPSLTAEMLQTVTANTDCNAYHVIVGALSSVFDQMTSLRQQELTPVMVFYLKQHRPWSSSCGSSTSSLSAWLEESFGKFSIYVDYKDLRDLHTGFDGFESLDLLSASQVAQLTLQSGALNNVHLMEMVFDRLEDGNAFHDIEEFLEALTRSSQDLDINPVVRDIMMNRTFTIISLHFADFLSHDWVSWFTVKLVPLLPSLTAEMLQTVTANTDCNAYHVIVGALSSVFDQMTSLRQQELTPVMVFYLKQHRPWSSSCGSSTSSLSAWLEESFGKFSIYVDYKDLRDLHTGFDGFESLDLLSASQVAQLTLQSGALNNVHLMEMVYDRLEDGNAFHDIEEFLEALTRSSQDLDINPVVRDIMMNRTFTIISLHFADFLSHDWVSWFTVKLVPLLPSLTAEMLQTVTANTDCNAYHVIVGALSSVFDQMTSLRQQELTPVMVFYLKQHRPWSSSCGSSTSSLSAWLEESFGKFSIYVDYKDLRDLHTGFDGFESLDLLSASQVAQLTLQSGALNNVHLMEMVFDRLEDGNAFHDIEEFLEALTRSSQDLDINPVVRDIMMNRTFTIISLHFADFLSHDWVSWFTVKLVPLLPSLTAEMLQTVTANTDCNAYHVIVGALSSVFDQMTSLRQQELTPVMVFYLKQHRPWSSSCGSSTSSLSAWLEESFGKFSIYVDYKDLRDLHTGFDGFESLDLLSASQVAQLTLQSGALNNVHLMEMVFDRLEDGNAFHDIEEFLEALTRSSQDLDINPVVRDIMMNRTFTIISLHFADFLSHDWVSWFTVKLVPLLPSLTAEMLQTVTANTDCNAYHVIVGALSSVFDQMTSLRQQELTPVMVFYLKQHRPWSSSCGSSTSSLSAWLEESFGKFSIYVDYKDLRDLHTGFDGFESLDLLSASQVAQLTLQSGALNNVHLMEMVFDRLEDGNAFHDIEEFLEALTRSSQDLDINPVVRDIMMNRTFTIISLHFANFLSHDWVSWFTVKLVPLLPSLTGEMLQTVTANTDCNAYHVIVGALSSVFDQMTSLRQQELTPVMVFYLKQHRPWSSSCGSSTSSLSAWLEESFGKFSIYVDYKDLRDLHTGFDGFESLDLLSASQVAQLTLQSGALNNVHLMEMVFDRLEDGNAFHDIEEFLEALTRSSQDLDINPVVRDIMMNRTFTIISLHFADFLSHDWVSWFTVKLVPLLPSLTAEMLQTVTANTDCNAYHVIVGALSSVFDQMTSLRQQELTPVMVFYLKQHRPWSSSCGSSTSSLSAWLEESFGKFSIYVDYKDLRDLHTGFDGFESLDLLSASQVAQLTLQSGALNNVHLMEMVFDRLEDGNAFHDIEEFLEALTRSSQDLDINPVVRDIMMNRTFTIISLHFADFLSHDWVSWFTVKLVPLLPSLTAEMLQTVTANTDCNAYHVIVGALSSVFDQMTSLRQQELTPVMVFYLKQHRPWSSSCGSSTSSLSAWLEESFGKFSIYVDYKDLRDLHTGFDGFESLDLLSASQVAQLTLQSGALNNVHLMEMVFDRLEDGNAFHDIEEFLEALTRSSQDLDINPVVRDIMMNRTFTIISLHFADFLSHDWVSWFTVKLVPLLPSLTGEMLQTVTANTDCNAYHVIVGALSSVFDQMTSLRQQELTPVMVFYLKQHRPWSSSCGSSTSSLSAWLEESFGKFSIYVDYKDLRDLHTGFDGFESLDLLSASQVAQLTLQSGALNNVHLMEMVFDRLEDGNAFHDIEEFLEALTRSSQDLDINPVVRDIMMNRTFTIISLHFADFLSHDWVSWFTVKLVPLLPSLTAEMLQTVTANTDCNAYHVIVGALSSVFDQMTSLRQQELTPVMVFYLKQHRPWSSSCGSSTSSLSAWLEESFGKFSIYVDYKDLRDLHTGFDGFESLDLLSASQVAQLTLQSGALNNVHLMEMVFDRLEDGNAFHDIEEFLEALTRSSQDLDINPVVRDIMMNRTFTIISLHFADFLSHDWVSWFTVKLVPLLPSLTAEMLQTVTANTDCNAYHVIVGALSSVFDQMTSLRQQELTPVMVFYLKQHRPWSSSCGSSTSSLSAWLEESFGKFSIYVDYKDLRDLHTGFDGFESLDLLSASQVAQLTLQSGALNNVHLMEMVFDRLEDGNAFHDIEEFLEALTRSSQDLDINPVVRDIMMNRTFTIISLHFADFLSHDWVSWFTVKLVPLLPSLTAEMLQTVTANTDCNAYHVIVGALSSVFDQMTSLRQQELTPVMVFYLKQHRPWSSSCGSSTSSLSAWLEESFGKFSIYVDYKDLRDLHTGFDGFESLDLLSASQVAQLTLQSGALNNVHLMEMVFDRLEDGNAFHDIEEFLEALTRSSQDLDINPVVRDIMMNRTFTIISLHFADFLSHDWVSWFTVKLVPLLPSLTAEMLQTVTANTDCNAYHVIVGALSSVFDQMTSLRQQELTPVMVFYLKQHRPWSSSCGSSTSSLSAWLEESFGKFSIYVDYKDLRDLHTGFDGFESLDLLSASQVAQLTLQSGALNNVHLMEMVFDRLEDGNAFHDIEEFLEALTRSSQDLDINPVVRDIMMNRTFTIISLHFADFLSHDWVSWFTVKLVPLLPSLTAEMLQTVTANTDCNAYHVIVGALSSVFDQMTSLRQQELTPVMVFYLKQHRPWSSSCGSSTSSLSAWLEESFGKFSIYVDYKDLRDLHTGFDGFESLDLLSASQVAQLTLQSGALNNVHLMEMVFDRLEDGNAFHDIEEFLEALTRSSQDLDINPVVRDIMMNRTFTIISLHFADFLSHDWVSWFTVKLVPLLPSLTAEMLQTVTANTDCNAYHVIVGALSSVFDQMTSLRQQELTPVMVFYLKQHRPWSSSCGSSTSSLSAWLEESFGKFSIYVDYKDLRDLHTGFDGFESLDLLSASQVAQLTLQSGALNNVHLMEMVFDRLEDGNAFHDIEEFLEALTRSSQDLDINPVVRDIMMNRTFTIISLHFADFLSHDWVSWFTVKLVPLLPSLTGEMLQTVTANTDCNAYHVIVGALSSVFDQMTSLRQQELTPIMVFYLKQHRPWSSSCGSSTSSLSAWLEESFGKFSIYVDYKDLRDLHTGFDGFESLDLLSASQVAQLTLQSGALNNVHLMEMVFDRLEDGNAFHDIEEFLEALTRSSQVCCQL